MLLPEILPDVGTSQDWLSNDPSAPMTTLQRRVRPSTVNRSENLLSLTVSALNLLCPVFGKHSIDCQTHFPSNEVSAGGVCGQVAVAASNTGHAARIEMMCFTQLPVLSLLPPLL